MQFPFFNLGGVLLLFLQALFVFLRFEGVGNFNDTHWGVILLPTFFAEFLVLALWAGKATAQGRSRPMEDERDPRTAHHPEHLSNTLLHILAVVCLILATVFLAFYLNGSSELPFSSVSVSLFCCTTLWLVSAVIKYRKPVPATINSCPEQPVDLRRRLLASSCIFFVQGLFLLLRDGPMGHLFPVSLWIVLSPTLFFIVLSFYYTARQTRYRIATVRDLLRQGSFLVLLLLAFYGIAAYIVHASYPTILSPRWIVLPFMIYSALMTLMLFYVTCMPSDPRVAYGPVASTPDPATVDVLIPISQPPTFVSNSSAGFLTHRGYEQPAFGHSQSGEIAHVYAAHI